MQSPVCSRIGESKERGPVHSQHVLPEVSTKNRTKPAKNQNQTNQKKKSKKHPKKTTQNQDRPAMMEARDAVCANQFDSPVLLFTSFLFGLLPTAGCLPLGCIPIHCTAVPCVEGALRSVDYCTISGILAGESWVWTLLICFGFAPSPRSCCVVWLIVRQCGPTQANSLNLLKEMQKKRSCAKSLDSPPGGRNFS